MLGQYTRVLQGPEGDDDDDRVTAVRIEERHKSRVLSAMILVLPICLGTVAVPRSFGWDPHGDFAIIDAAMLGVLVALFVGFRCLWADAFSTMWLVLPLGLPPLFIGYALLWMTAESVRGLLEEQRTNRVLTAVMHTVFGGIHSTLPRGHRWKVGVLAGRGALMLLGDVLLSYAHGLDTASLMLFNAQHALLPSAAGFVLVHLLIRIGGEVLDARLLAMRMKLADSERRNGELETARRQAVAGRFMSYYESEYGARRDEPSETSSSEEHGAGSEASHFTAKLGNPHEPSETSSSEEHGTGSEASHFTAKLDNPHGGVCYTENYCNAELEGEMGVAVERR
jgi:hypothetical protein